MIAGARYGHTNLIAKDWRRLARFYRSSSAAFRFRRSATSRGGSRAGNRDPGAELRGEHLRLPGHGADGPTLEIFNYNVLKERPTGGQPPGFGHIAFVVDDVSSAREAVLAAGGQPVGDMVTLTTATGAKVTWVS